MQVPEVAAGAAKGMLSSHVLREDNELRAVIVDGCLDQGLSNLSGLPDGVYIGSIQDAPEEVVAMRLVSPASRPILPPLPLGQGPDCFGLFSVLAFLVKAFNCSVDVQVLEGMPGLSDCFKALTVLGSVW